MYKKWLIASVLLNVLALAGFVLLIQKLGGLNYVWFKWKHDGISGVYMHKKDIQKKLTIERGGIVFIGNSITAQGPWRELLGRADVYNRGIEGDMTRGLLERLPGVLAAEPAKLFVMIGINDLINHSEEEVVGNYKEIIDLIRQQSPATSVYIQSILPVNNEVRQSGISNESVRRINESLRKLAQQNDLTFVDLNALLQDAQGKLKATFTSDGIHINGDAYLIWRDALLKYLDD